MDALPGKSGVNLGSGLMRASSSSFYSELDSCEHFRNLENSIAQCQPFPHNRGMPAQSPQSAPEDLAYLLAPLEPGFFFKEHWNRRALYLPGEPGKFAGLFGRDAFDAAIHDCSQLKINYLDEKGWPTERKISPAEVPELLANG